MNKPIEMDNIPIEVVQVIHGFIPRLAPILRMVCRSWRKLHRSKRFNMIMMLEYPKIFMWALDNGSKAPTGVYIRPGFWDDIKSLAQTENVLKLHSLILKLTGSSFTIPHSQFGRIFWQRIVTELPTQDVVNIASTCIYYTLPFAACVECGNLDLLETLMQTGKIKISWPHFKQIMKDQPAREPISVVRANILKILVEKRNYDVDYMECYDTCFNSLGETCTNYSNCSCTVDIKKAIKQYLKYADHGWTFNSLCQLVSAGCLQGAYFMIVMMYSDDGFSKHTLDLHQYTTLTLNAITSGDNRMMGLMAKLNIPKGVT